MWEVRLHPEKGGYKFSPAPANEAVGDNRAITLEMKVRFVAALLWHPGDQLCHGTQEAPGLMQRLWLHHSTQQTPGFSYEQSWDRSFPFKC